MHDLDRNEDRLRGTYDFPFEFHHIESNHPRYVMSYHWHVEYEIIRILKGHFKRKKLHRDAGGYHFCAQRHPAQRDS